eukprot:994243-Rhodomonas_salina.1
MLYMPSVCCYIRLLLHAAISLRVCYAMSGTDVAYVLPGRLVETMTVCQLSIAIVLLAMVQTRRYLLRMSATSYAVLT